eukprot:9483080-Pyramimonas_sp.AAC.1
MASQLQLLIGDCAEDEDKNAQNVAVLALSSTLTTRLKEGGGFNHPAFREAFVLCKVSAPPLLRLANRLRPRMILAHLKPLGAFRLWQMRLAEMYFQEGKFQDAMCEIDTAFIMGGPVNQLQAMLALVEPSAKSAFTSNENMQNRGDNIYAASRETEEKHVVECPLFSEHNHIPRVRAEQLTVKDFRKNFFKTPFLFGIIARLGKTESVPWHAHQTDTPVVIEGAMTSWAGTKKWGNLQWLRKEHGHRTVPIELGRHADGSLQ